MKFSFTDCLISGVKKLVVFRVSFVGFLLLIVGRMVYMGSWEVIVVAFLF